MNSWSSTFFFLPFSSAISALVQWYAIVLCVIIVKKNDEFC